jgi:hypothetical protein
MKFQLTDDQRQVITEHGETPVYLEDPATNQTYVLLRVNEYKQTKPRFSLLQVMIAIAAVAFFLAFWNAISQPPRPAIQQAVFREKLKKAKPRPPLIEGVDVPVKAPPQ